MKDQIENVSHIFESLLSKATDGQAKHSDIAQKFGYLKRTLSGMQSNWRLFENNQDEDTTPLIVSGSTTLQALDNRLIQFEERDQPDIDLLDGCLSTVDMIGSATTAVALAKPHSIEGSLAYYHNQFYNLSTGRESVAKTLESIDSPLGACYKSIWDSLYGTAPDPIRGALFFMRQTYDHFFSIFAPDDKVRNSPYWEPKTEGNKNRVYRTERLKYAAETHITDELLKAIVLSSTKLMLDTYQVLNKCHRRNELNDASLEPALDTMDKLLNQWLTALGH